MDGMDYDIMLAANGTITPGYSSGDEDAEEEDATNEIIMGTALQFAGDQAAVEFGADNSNEDELGEEESDPGDSDPEKIDAGMFDASDSDASDSGAIVDDNAATGLHTIVQDGEATLAGPVFYIPGASKLSPINLASDDDKMSTQEAQAVFDKVDEVQMKLDEALDILEELKGDGNTLFLKQKYPQMKLMETITVVQAKLTTLTNGEMEFMTNELQNLGAKFNLDDAPAVAVAPAATTNKRPATVPTSPAPGNAANANKRPAIAAGPSSPAIFSSPRVPRAPPAYIPPPPGHVIANTGTFRGHPAQLPMFKEDLKAEDRLMIQMKTGKKHSWDQITDAYVAMIDKEINQSTLTSRWGKMKKSYGEDALIAWGEELREAEYMRQVL